MNYRDTDTVHLEDLEIGDIVDAGGEAATVVGIDIAACDPYYWATITVEFGDGTTMEVTGWGNDQARVLIP